MRGGGGVGEERELRELVAQLAWTKTGSRDVKWNLNPPLAPHFGGVDETMIKVAKRAAYVILGSADVTDEELTTVFTGAEALINSRPLTYQSENPLDDVPLTPDHFLFRQVGSQFAPELLDSSQFSPRKRWRRVHVQEMVRHFWRRWLREWL